MKTTIAVLVVLLITISLVRAQTTTTAPSAENKHTTASGLTIIEIKQLKEPLRAQAGDRVWVHYTGKLQSGKVFDSSLNRNEPISFKLGAGEVIKGWDEGLVGMQVGEKRQLIIPPKLAYGDQEQGNGMIPANSTLIFDVQMIGIDHPEEPQVPGK